MDFFKQEKEISIKDMFFCIAIKWRSILYVMLLAALATFIVNIVPSLKYAAILGVGVVGKALVTQIALVCVVSVICIIAVYVVVFMFTDTIKSANECASFCSIPIIGCIVKKKHKKNNILDICIKKGGGIKYRVDDVEQHKQCLSKIVENVVLKDQKESKKRIVVVSSYSLECAERIKEAIDCGVKSNIEVLVAGDIRLYPDAIDKIASAEYVICAECQGKSKYHDLKKLVTEIAGWKKEIVGIVIEEVDGI